MTDAIAHGRGGWRLSRPRSVATLAVGGFALVTSLGYVAVVDPHDPAALMPKCPTKLVTGLDCPACGGLRMTHDLLHGDLGAAVHDNLFLLIVLPLIAVFEVWRLRRGRRGRRGRPADVPRALPVALLVLALLWMLVRNLPTWPLKPA